MCDPTGTVCGIDPLSPRASGPHELVLEVGLRQVDCQVPRVGKDCHAARRRLQTVVFIPGNRHTLNPEFNTY